MQLLYNATDAVNGVTCVNVQSSFLTHIGTPPLLDHVVNNGKLLQIKPIIIMTRPLISKYFNSIAEVFRIR